jgi:hypothetical protein
VDSVLVGGSYSEPEGIPGKLGSTDPNGQFGDVRLIDAKQNVEIPEGDSGDIGASGASEGEAGGPLDPHGLIVPQEAVGCDDDSGPQGDTMVRPCVHQ